MTRLKLIGDAYIAASGLSEKRTVSAEDHVKNAICVVQFALDVVQKLDDFNDANGTDIRVRIGIHTGQVKTALVGRHKSFEIYGGVTSHAMQMDASFLPVD